MLNRIMAHDMPIIKIRSPFWLLKFRGTEAIKVVLSVSTFVNVFNITMPALAVVFNSWVSGSMVKFFSLVSTFVAVLGSQILSTMMRFHFYL